MSASDVSTSDLSSVQLLKARRIYQKLRQNILETTGPQGSNELLAEHSKATGSDVVHLEACIALFEYLSSGIQSLLSMCNEFISLISCGVSSPSGLREMDIELILTFYVKLFKFHSKLGQTLPLKNIRHIALFGLERFPDNPKFLSFYIERESKSILTGELRRTLDRATLKAETPLPWIFALYYEQLRAESLVSVMECTDSPSLGAAAVTSLPVTGVVHRQYALFERAVSSSSGRHCVALWRMYMEFEACRNICFAATSLCFINFCQILQSDDQLSKFDLFSVRGILLSLTADLLIVLRISKRQHTKSFC